MGCYNSTLVDAPIDRVWGAGQTFVLWTSSWESSGGGVAELCNPIYQALLGDLQQTFAAN